MCKLNFTPIKLSLLLLKTVLYQYKIKIKAEDVEVPEAFTKRNELLTSRDKYL